MVVEASINERVHLAVEAALDRFGAHDDELIPILSHVNHEIGYLPGQALEEIAHALKKPKSKVFTVASFYGMLSTIPVGKHVIRFCESAPCHVVGGRQVIAALKQALRINPGETSADGQWTLLAVSCLGICAVGPAFIVDDDVYGNVTPDQVSAILQKYQA
jgi:NADH:ubiquinone oxidoreductase subunit E